MAEFLVFLGLCCICGVFYDIMPLGIIFVISLVMVIYTVLSLIQKNKLDAERMFVAITGLLLLAYTVCVLFLHIDVLSVLGLTALLEQL